MKITLIIALCAGLIVSGVALAGGKKLDQQFSGRGHATMIDTNGDGTFAAAINFESRGSPGPSSFLAMGEFTAFTPGDCPGGVPRADLVQESFVQTFRDLSMLFYEATAGHICFDPITTEVNCDIEGIFTGGTGRFEGATGPWTVECELFSVGASVSATTGTLKGRIELPHKKGKHD
jgi:hypothetical protein